MKMVRLKTSALRSGAGLIAFALCHNSALRAQVLQSYYSFDSGTVGTSGANITSASGRGSTLNAINTPKVDAAGKFGGAADFSSGRLDTPTYGDGSATLGNNFSISFWMKTSDVTQISQSYVLQTGGDPTPQNAILFGYAPGKIELYGNTVSGSTDPRSISGISLDTSLNNQWFNVIYSYDGSHLKGYLNGAQQFDAAANFSMDASGGLSVGGSRNSNPANAALIPGSLDDVAIFHGALSQSQVTAMQNMTAMSAVPEPSEYAAMTGAALLGFSLWWRRKGISQTQTEVCR